MATELENLLSKPTASVPDVGRICFGLNTNAAYLAAKRGDFPTIRIGKLIKVPTAPLRTMLGIDAVAQ